MRLSEKNKLLLGDKWKKVSDGYWTSRGRVRLTRQTEGWSLMILLGDNWAEWTIIEEDPLDVIEQTRRLLREFADSM